MRVFALLGGLLCGVWSRETVHLPQTNLLFIIFDDLRPELSIYGKEWMNTPNFERLADKGVVFDLAVSQVSACNPSRNSLLSGMRPDTMASYNAQTNYGSHKLLPHYLVNAGYKTAAYGKIRHFEEWDKSLWTEEYYEGSLYRQQGGEHGGVMNATSVVPDHHLPEERFTDHDYATRAIHRLREFSSQDGYYMTAVGFKLPHSPLHVPQSYYDAYNEQQQGTWKEREESVRSYPPGAPYLGYPPGEVPHYRYLGGGGSAGIHDERTGDATMTVSQRMYTELHQGYAAAVSFADAQLGRILDVVDELKLWSNLTVVVTADHGMHLGEKGVYGKGTLFDESGRVPLIIAHPASPYKKSHVYEPVELVDVFPTVLDLVSSPHIRSKSIMHAHSRAAKQEGGGANRAGAGGAKHTRQAIRKREGGRHEELGGKSLAPLIVGSKYKLSLQRGGGGTRSSSHRHAMHSMSGHRTGFAVTQALRCIPAQYKEYDPRTATTTATSHAIGPQAIWTECDVNNKTEMALLGQVTVMGYSMRTLDFRYTVWLYFDRVDNLIEWDKGVIAEELYDHREDGQDSLGKAETVNLLAAYGVDASTIAAYKETAGQQRNLLIGFLQRKVTFRKHLLSHWEHDAAYEAHETAKQAFNRKWLVVDGGENESGSEVPHKKLTRKEEKKLKEFIRENAQHER